MTKCIRPDCNNEVSQEGTRRPRKYCSDNCKQIVWQRSKKGLETPKNSVKNDPYKEGGLYRFENGGFVEQLIEKQRRGASFNITEAMEARLGKNTTLPPNKEDEKKGFKKCSSYKFGVVGINEDGSQQEVVQCTPEVNKELTAHFVGNDILLKEIKEIEAEKIPKDRDTIIGRKSWAKEQQKRIQSLKGQLK